MFGSFQFGAASLAEPERAAQVPAIAGGIGGNQFGQGQLAQPNISPPTPATAAAGIGSFAFGQSWFAQPDGTIGLLPARATFAGSRLRLRLHSPVVARPASGPDLVWFAEWLKKQKRKASPPPAVARFSGCSHYVLAGSVKARTPDDEEAMIALALLLLN